MNQVCLGARQGLGWTCWLQYTPTCSCHSVRLQLPVVGCGTHQRLSEQRYNPLLWQTFSTRRSHVCIVTDLVLRYVCACRPCRAWRHTLPHQGSLNSRALMRDIIKANNLAELRDISNGNMGSLDAIHVNTIFQRAGAIAVNTRAPEQARHCLAGLVPLWSTLLPDASTSSMSSTLLTAGKLSFTDARLWSRTVAQVLTRMQQTTSFDVTNVIYALARVSLVNKGQVPGMGREEVVAAVQTLLRRLLTMVQWPRQEDGLAFLSISNCLWALARLNIQPTADQLSTLLSAALRPVLFDSAALDHYAVFVWSLAELQYRSGLYGKIKIAPEAQAVLFTPDKVCLADRLCDDHLRYMLCSLGLLVQTGAVEREGAAWAAGEVLLAELETRPNWASTDPADPLWGAAVLGLPVQQLLTRDLLRRLVAWAPSAKSVSIARLAELLVLTNHAHAGLVSAALQGAKKAMRVAPGQRTIEADRCCV